MWKRKLKQGSLLSALILFISNAAAQISVGDREYDSLSEFFVEFYGFPSDFSFLSLDAIGYYAGFLLFVFIYYLGLEAAIKRTGSDLLKEVTGLKGSYGSSSRFQSKRLFMMSVLAVLTTFTVSAGAFQAQVVTLGSVMLIGFFGLIAIVALLTLAGIMAGARSASGAVGGQVRDTAENNMNRVNNLMGNAEEEDEEGRTEEAIRDMERALRVLEEVEENLDEMLEADITELEDAVQKARDIYGTEEREIEFEEDLEQLDDKIRENVKEILPPPTGDVWDNTREDELEDRFVEIQEATQKIRHGLEDLEKAESSDPSVSVELKELEDAAKKALKSYELMSKLREYLEEGEGEIQHLAQEVGENDQIEVEENQIRQLENQFQQLEQMENQLISELEDAEEILERQVAITEEEREILVKLFGEMKSTDKSRHEESIEELRNYLNTQPIDNTVWQGLVDVIEDFIENQILPEIERLEELDEQEENEESKVLEELRKILEQLRD